MSLDLSVLPSYLKLLEELCRDCPGNTVILDHMAFCKTPSKLNYLSFRIYIFCFVLNSNRLLTVAILQIAARLISNVWT
jgi:hypothetical protein